MRNNISACGFTGIPDGECTSKVIYEPNFDSFDDPEKEWWELKMSFGLNSSLEKVERKQLVDRNAKSFSVTLLHGKRPAEEDFLEETQEWTKLRHTVNLDCVGRNVELKTNFGFDSSLGKVETKESGDVNANGFSVTLLHGKCPAEENLREETQEWTKLRHTVHLECVGRNVDSARASGAARRLPEEVVERILAMIPFPDILKVRSISKGWYRKFPHQRLEGSRSICGRMDEKRQPARKDRDCDWSSSNSFLTIVSSVSVKWSVYCPLILGNEGLMGYDRVRKTWQGLFTNLQQLLGSTVEPWLIKASGPLISGVSQSPNSQYHVLITNVLTRRWRKLPPHPSLRVPSLLNVLFNGADGYKVFLVTEDPYEGPHDDCSGHDSNLHSRRCVSAEVFDSLTGTWTTSQSEVPCATSFAWRSCSVMFDGNIYCLSGDDRNPIDHPLQVWVYSLRDESWTEIGHPFGLLVNKFSGTSVLFDLTRFGLFVCGSKIVVALALHRNESYDDRVGANTLGIYELDPATRAITFKSRGPPATVLGNSEHIVNDGENIYFCTLDLLACYPIVVYNVKSGQWSCLAPDFKTAGFLTNKRWADFAFQPGLNPFTVL